MSVEKITAEMNAMVGEYPAALDSQLVRDISGRSREMLSQRLNDIADLYEMAGLGTDVAIASVGAMLCERYAILIAEMTNMPSAEAGRALALSIDLIRAVRQAEKDGAAA